MKHYFFSALLIAQMAFFSNPLHGELLGPRSAVYVMPINCSELMPDNTPFTGYFMTVAQGAVTTDKKLASQMFEILALKQTLADKKDWATKINPVEVLIRKVICFYRQEKEPLKVIPYDDQDFITFLKTAMPELETRINDAIYQIAFEKTQKKMFELRLSQNQKAVESLRKKAAGEARTTFKKLTADAAKKAAQ